MRSASGARHCRNHLSVKVRVQRVLRLDRSWRRCPDNWRHCRSLAADAPLFQPPAEVRHTASIATELLWRVEVGDKQQPHERRRQAIGFLFKGKAPVGNLPALITSGDLLPGGGALNGRRWAGQQLLKSWAACSGPGPWL